MRIADFQDEVAMVNESELAAFVVVVAAVSTALAESLFRRAGDRREAAFLPPEEREAFLERLSEDRRQKRLRVNPAVMCPSCGVSGRVQARRVKRTWRQQLGAPRAPMTDAHCVHCDATWQL